MQKQPVFFIPDWVPEAVHRYLAHTEAGQSIRDLARVAGCHASTVMRQIRRIETRRDDPLVDGGLSRLAQDIWAGPPQGPVVIFTHGKTAQKGPDALPSGEVFDRDAIRVLRRLCETGAVLAVARDMDNAVVVRDSAGGPSTKTAAVTRPVAEVLALRDWIACANSGRISRYHITSTGRAALGQLLAAAENRARNEQEAGFAETQTGFIAGSSVWSEAATGPDTETPSRRVRYNMAESPLSALARRKDRDGQAFLPEDLVRAGERLREDFELAQMGHGAASNADWHLAVAANEAGQSDLSGDPVSSPARGRVTQALSDLGPGLSDVALRCCCYLEGLEITEKQMGWSARSGKIVLRIALQRLKRHYESLSEAQMMIG